MAIIYGWFIAWLVMPVAIWDDAKFVRTKSEWTPRKWLYVLPSLVPLVVIVPGIIYLIKKRHRHIGVP